MGHDDDRSDLMQRGVDAALWGVLGASVRIVLQMISQVVLARLLGPEIFGIFVLALALVLLASLFSDFGLAYGLIQRSTIDDAVIRFVFTWQMVLGVVLTLLLVAIAPLLAHGLGDARLTAVIRWLALSCVVASVGATAGMLLRRRLDFKTLNLIAVVSYAVGFLALGIPLAVAGYGVWSLVVGNLAQLAIASVMTFLAVRHPVAPLLRHPDRRAIVNFGTTVLATNLLNWLMMSLDRLVIGFMLQAKAAGLYATMSNLMVGPVGSMISALQSALYSTSARAQDDPQRLRFALRSVLGAVALFLAPVFFAIGITAETLVLAVFGDRWAGGGAVLQPIAFAMPAYILMGMAIPTLWAMGRTQWEFWLQLPMATLWVLALGVIGSYGSLVVLSWSVCAWFCLRAVVICTAACHVLKLGWRDFLKPMAAGGIVTVMVSCAAAAVDRWLSAPPILAELAIIAASGLAFLVGVVAVRSVLTDEVRLLLDQVLKSVPPPLGQMALRRFFGGPATGLL